MVVYVGYLFLSYIHPTLSYICPTQRAIFIPFFPVCDDWWTTLLNLYQRLYRIVQSRWQSCANMMAEKCNTVGTTMPTYWHCRTNLIIKRKVKHPLIVFAIFEEPWYHEPISRITFVCFMVLYWCGYKSKLLRWFFSKKRKIFLACNAFCYMLSRTLCQNHESI